jgi:hypothetical protein
LRRDPQLTEFYSIGGKMSVVVRCFRRQAPCGYRERDLLDIRATELGTPVVTDSALRRCLQTHQAYFP